MTLPLEYQVTTDIAWLMVSFLLFIYVYRMTKKNGYRDYKCQICKEDVRKKYDNRYLRLVAHDRFTWRNPMSFFEIKRFCSFPHLKQWVDNIAQTTLQLESPSEPITEPQTEPQPDHSEVSA